MKLVCQSADKGLNEQEYEESLKNIKKYRTNAKKIISNITGIEYNDSY
jgi:hypothetical protein